MFGDRLRIARKAAKLTQEELAEKIGVKRSVISKYENGIIDPSISQVQKIADALGIPAHALYDPVSWVQVNGEYHKEIIHVLSFVRFLYERSYALDPVLEQIIIKEFPNFPEELDRVCSLADTIVQASIGSMMNPQRIANADDELKLLLLFRSLNPDGQKFALEYLGGLAENSRYNQIPGEDK